MAAAQSILPLQIPRLADDITVPSYAEAPCFHLKPRTVLAHLEKIDWSFEKEDTGFLGHDLHPYPAKFIPQIPGNLISRLSLRGELVLDPFGGSGTTALESVRLGRRAISVDANPLSALIGRAKTASVDHSASLELHGFQAALTSELMKLPADPKALISAHAEHIPNIPNREKWFADSAFGELGLIKARIAGLDTLVARDLALVALSRIVIKVSYQDSETRYKSVIRAVPIGETLRRFLKEFRVVMATVADSEAVTRHGISKFIFCDSRNLRSEDIADGSVDLVVTSPPYGNATDYHLYHRFRLLWLGFDPIELGHKEIGSHLKHQREGSGFDSYFKDLELAVCSVERVLRPGRYAAFVLGDSIYEGQNHNPAKILAEKARDLGFDSSFIIERPIHANKRSFAHAGRRASSESIVVLRKKVGSEYAHVLPPPYKLWPYEKTLRLREANLPAEGTKVQDAAGKLIFAADAKSLSEMRNLVFSHHITSDGTSIEPTWQATLENGNAANPGARKDPKYVTHGLHPYKGKFYPQLAKGLLNLAKLKEGARILDPFCGSGTTLLEGYLNGYQAFGCDMNPLAARIAKAKVEILECDPDLVVEAISTVLETIDELSRRLPKDSSEFNLDCLSEISRWFPEPVIRKLNAVLKVIRKSSAGPIQNFLEVVLSSVIRDVSQQEPSDLRVRYRKEAIADADVVGLFRSNLESQYSRIEKFWNVRGRAPRKFHPANVITGDNRDPKMLVGLGIEQGSIDAVLTSPPYLTALPYIDTDRLSLLTIVGLTSSQRRPIEGDLIGSREISVGARKLLEDKGSIDQLPQEAAKFISSLQRRLSKDVEAGFRKQNMPALLARYLLDMKSALINAHFACKIGAEAMIVIGDNRTEIGEKLIRIPTTDLVEEIATCNGFESIERIDISVTKENYLHQKNAITENVVLRLRKVA